MNTRVIYGIIIGGVFGLVTAGIAMSSALPAGGLIALAGAFDGLMGGLGIGWLIGINIAENPGDEEEQYVSAHELPPIREAA